MLLPGPPDLLLVHVDSGDIEPPIADRPRQVSLPAPELEDLSPAMPRRDAPAIHAGTVQAGTPRLRLLGVHEDPAEGLIRREPGLSEAAEGLRDGLPVRLELPGPLIATLVGSGHDETSALLDQVPHRLEDLSFRCRNALQEPTDHGRAEAPAVPGFPDPIPRDAS